MPEHVLFGGRPGARGAGSSSSNERPVRPARGSCRPHCRVGVDGCVEIGPDDVDTVQACLGLDGCGTLQIVIGDGEVEVFLHQGKGPVSVLWPGPVPGRSLRGWLRWPAADPALGARCWRSRQQTRRRSPTRGWISATVSGTSASDAGAPRQDYPWGPSAVCGGRPCAGPRSSPGRPVTDRCGCVPR